MTAPLVFMDTETTGLSLDDDIWEFAAICRDPDGTETELHLFIEHNEDRCRLLPESFRADHYKRFPHDHARKQDAALAISRLFDGKPGAAKPHVVGAVPNFDTERVARLLAQSPFPSHRPPWHHHLIDVEALALGYLFGQYKTRQREGIWLMPEGPATLALPWDSNVLSGQVGVNPDDFDRHTAMGDVRWAMAIYDAVMGGAA